MKISKILYKESSDVDKALVVCDIVFDNVFKVMGVRLYKNDKGYYLIFPSKQDILNEMNISVSDKKEDGNDGSKKKDWDEFYYPIDSAFYACVRDIVVEGYIKTRNKTGKTYIP